MSRAPGKHAPIVEEDVFRRASKEGVRHRTAPGRYKARVVYELSCLIRCGECGYVMPGSTTRSYRYYRDGSFCRGQGCRQKRVRADIMEGEINKIIDGLAILDHKKERILALLDTPKKPDRPGGGAAAKTKLERAKFLYMNGDISRDEYMEVKRGCEAQLAPPGPEPGVNVERILALLDAPADFWQKATPAERLERNRLLLDSVYVRDGAITAIKPKPPFDSWFVECVSNMIQ